MKTCSVCLPWQNAMLFDQADSEIQLEGALPEHKLDMYGVQVEPFDIANYYRMKLHRNGTHYIASRPYEFWRLDEMCQHEARANAREQGQQEFLYKFSLPWADHMTAVADITEPRHVADIPAPLTEPLPVPVTLRGKVWCEGVTLANVNDAAMARRQP